MIHIDKRKKELGVVPLMICLIIKARQGPMGPAVLSVEPVMLTLLHHARTLESC